MLLLITTMMITFQSAGSTKKNQRHTIFLAIEPYVTLKKVESCIILPFAFVDWTQLVPYKEPHLVHFISKHDQWQWYKLHVLILHRWKMSRSHHVILLLFPHIEQSNSKCCQKRRVTSVSKVFFLVFVDLYFPCFIDIP